MKNTSALLLALLFAFNGFTQTKKFSNTFYFLAKEKVTEYRGKKFRYTADVKVVAKDIEHASRIQAIQIGRDDYDFLQFHITPNTASDTLWHSISATGIIVEAAKKIWLYVVQEGNGLFYVDNMKFEIQGEDSSWTSLPVSNGDFEQINKDPLKGFQTGRALPAGTTLQFARSENGHNGNALLISATGGTSSWVTNYGSNSATGRYCKVNGIRIYYETYGEGEPLLLLHGNGGSIASFAKEIPALAEKYNVISVDTRAQGKSTDTGSGKLSYDIFAEDMKVLLDSLHLKKVNIVGWSDGGNTALTMAIRYPEYVNKIMTMGANLNPSDSAVEKSILSQAAKDLKKLNKKDDPASGNIKRLITMTLNEPNITTDDLHKISTPALIMAGEKDLIKEQHTKLIADNIKGAKLEIFKGQTHFIPEEAPEIFTKALLDFLGG